MKAAKRFKNQDRERVKDREIKLARKKIRGKRTKKVFDAPCESIINTVVGEHLMRNFTC